MGGHSAWHKSCVRPAQDWCSRFLYYATILINYKHIHQKLHLNNNLSYIYILLSSLFVHAVIHVKPGVSAVLILTRVSGVMS